MGAAQTKEELQQIEFQTGQTCGLQTEHPTFSALGSDIGQTESASVCESVQPLPKAN